MSDLLPFRGLLYDVAASGPLRQVTSPPYDTITDEEQRTYMASSPFNIVHLEFNERGADSGDRASQYMEAAADLRSWRESGVLVQDDLPAYYPYEMTFDLAGRRRRIRGVIGAVEVEPWGGSIIPHERTMDHQVRDRLGLIREVMANVSPVYSVFTGPISPLRDHLQEVTSAAPLLEVTDVSGVVHRLWRTHEEAIRSWLADESLLIADGHHRYTVGLQYKQEMTAAHGAGPWDQIMMFVVDAATEDPPVLPIHRILRQAPARREGEERAADLDEVLARVDDERLIYGTITMEGGSPRYATASLEGSPPLVQVLHQQVLGGLEIGADIGFSADPWEVERAVIEGSGTCGYILPPTSAERVRAVIDAEGRLPQKSTFFWPKPRTGLVVRPLDP